MDIKTLFLHYYPIIIQVVALLLSGLVAKILYDTFIQTRQLKKSWDKLYEQIRSDHIIKKEEIETIRKLYGDSYKTSSLEKVDALLSYSGIQLQIPGLNGALYVFLNFMLAALVIIGLLLTTHKLTWALLGAATTLLLPYLTLKIKSSMQYEATKRDFIAFMRMIATFSATYTDVLTILDVSSEYVGKAIRTKVKYAIIRGRGDGNIQDALKWLADNMQYQLFKDMIRSLEITSRNTLNYRKIIEEYMLIAEKKNTSMEKQKVIVKKGRMGILTMLLLGVGMFYMVLVSFNGSNDILQGLKLFLQNPMGILILAYMVAVALGSLWYMFFKMRCE